MFKDPDKQREANRQAARRARIKRRTTTDLTPLVVQGMTNEGMTPQGMTHYDAAYNYSHNPVSLVKPKRGLAIKCFVALPVDVQETIGKMVVVNGKIDQVMWAKRTAIAVNYQHLFPDRYYSTGVAI